MYYLLICSKEKKNEKRNQKSKTKQKESSKIKQRENVLPALGGHFWDRVNWMSSIYYLLICKKKRKNETRNQKPKPKQNESSKV